MKGMIASALAGVLAASAFPVPVLGQEGEEREERVKEERDERGRAREERRKALEERKREIAERKDKKAREIARERERIWREERMRAPHWRGPKIGRPPAPPWRVRPGPRIGQPPPPVRLRPGPPPALSAAQVIGRLRGMLDAFRQKLPPPLRAEFDRAFAAAARQIQAGGARPPFVVGKPAPGFPRPVFGPKPGTAGGESGPGKCPPGHDLLQAECPGCKPECVPRARPKPGAARARDVTGVVKVAAKRVSIVVNPGSRSAVTYQVVGSAGPLNELRGMDGQTVTVSGRVIGGPPRSYSGRILLQAIKSGEAPPAGGESGPGERPPDRERVREVTPTCPPDYEWMPIECPGCGGDCAPIGGGEMVRGTCPPGHKWVQLGSRGSTGKCEPTGRPTPP